MILNSEQHHVARYQQLALLGLVALAIVLGGALFYFVSKGNGVNDPVACTLEAKICPDGSAVGRVGPNCEFAPCPGETPPGA